MRRLQFLVLALLASLAAGLARAQERVPDPGLRPLLSYTGTVNGAAAGGQSQRGTYVHALAAGMQGPIAGAWSWTVQGAWTAGANLSAKAIGDVQGVQGPFNTGNGLWLYEVKAIYQTEAATLQAGRLSAGDALPGVAGMTQFVNSAFTSNGGAITINDPGRAATPGSTWGVWSKGRTGALELRGGALLSDPARMTLHKHGFDWSFRPGDGVLGFGEAVAPIASEFRAGLGGYADSARFTTFDGHAVRGNEGYYLWVERPAPDKGEALSGFAMLQAAQRSDRSLEPLSFFAGLTWQGLLAARPADAVSFGLSTARFSRDSALRGTETTLEADYRLTLTGHVNLRPDLQYVIHPGGRAGGRDALVLGVQVEAGI